MIVWRGAGVLVIFIIFTASLCANLLSISLAGKGYWETHSWPFASAMITAGGVIWLVDWILAKKPKRVLIDAETNERVLVGGERDFFFIPMKWWGPISVAIGAGSFLFGSTPGQM